MLVGIKTTKWVAGIRQQNVTSTVDVSVPFLAMIPLKDDASVIPSTDFNMAFFDRR